MSREEEDLATHVEICAIRYKGIEDKFDAVDARLDKIDSTLVDIKKMIETQRDTKFKTIVGAATTVVAGLLTVLGYLIVNMK